MFGHKLFSKEKKEKRPREENHSFLTPPSKRISTGGSDGELANDTNVDAPSVIPAVIKNKSTVGGGRLLSAEEAAEHIMQFLIVRNQHANLVYLDKEDADLKRSIALIQNTFYIVHPQRLAYKTDEEGTSVETYLAQNVKTSKWCILKRLITTNPEANLAKMMTVETAIHEKLNQLISKHETENEVCIVKEYVDGVDLNKITHLDLTEKLSIAMQMQAEIQRLHNLGILHCDINLANFVYDSNTKKVVVIDFDTSLLMNKNGFAQDKEIRFTPSYAAPELLSTNSGLYTYNEKTEVYALGAAWKELFAVELALNEASSNNLFASEKSATVSGLGNLINNMLHENPSNRSSLANCAVIANFVEIPENLISTTRLI